MLNYPLLKLQCTTITALADKNYYSPTAPAITSTPVTTGTVGEAYIL